MRVLAAPLRWTRGPNSCGSRLETMTTLASCPLLVSRANQGPPLALAVGDKAWVSYPPDAAVALPS